MDLTGFYTAIYSPFGVSADLTVGSADAVSITVNDLTKGVLIPDPANPGVKTLKPVVRVRRTELTELGVIPADLDGAILDLSGNSWTVVAWGPRPRANGEASSEIEMILMKRTHHSSPPLSISGSPVLTGRVGIAYAGFTVSASGGTAPYVFSVASGVLFPGGSLNSSTGVVSGMPSVAGSFTAVIRVRDAHGTTANLASFTTVIAAAGFTLYNAMSYTGQPDLLSFGLKRNRLLSQAELWSPSSNYTVPATEAAVRAAADRILAEGVDASVPVQLDVEQYPWDNRYNSNAVVDASIARLLEMIGWFKSQAPMLDVGYYGIEPTYEYYATVLNNLSAIAAWHSANDYLATFSQSEDTLYPSVYTFFNEPANWVLFANATIAEAKRIGGTKRILPYIWPQYHNGVPLEYQYVDYDYWLLQLRTIRDSGVAGAVLWGGYQTAWDGSQGWWQATQDFLASL